MIAEEPQKKWKLSHNIYSFGDFGITVAHYAKLVVLLAPNWMEVSMKTVKVEVVWMANEKAKKQEE